jgi:putative transposase
MARLPRWVIPGQPQHIILRGNNRTEIFCAEADYRFYLEKLQLACDKHGCDIHAYVLMTNRVHLLITPHQEHFLIRE